MGNDTTVWGVYELSWGKLNGVLRNRWYLVTEGHARRRALFPSKADAIERRDALTVKHPNKRYTVLRFDGRIIRLPTSAG